MDERKKLTNYALSDKRLLAKRVLVIKSDVMRNGALDRKEVMENYRKRFKDSV